MAFWFCPSGSGKLLSLTTLIDGHTLLSPSKNQMTGVLHFRENTLGYLIVTTWGESSWVWWHPGPDHIHCDCQTDCLWPLLLMVSHSQCQVRPAFPFLKHHMQPLLSLPNNHFWFYGTLCLWACIALLSLSLFTVGPQSKQHKVESAALVSIVVMFQHFMAQNSKHIACKDIVWYSNVIFDRSLVNVVCSVPYLM